MIRLPTAEGESAPLTNQKRVAEAVETRAPSPPREKLKTQRKSSCPFLQSLVAPP